MSVAIVAMVNHTAIHVEELEDDECDGVYANESSSSSDVSVLMISTIKPETEKFVIE